MTNINNNYIEESEKKGQLKKRLMNDNSNGTNGKHHKSSNSKSNQFMVGSIRKIVLKGFVTYDYCQFYPGPNLNMIIGPNGTGKSTIVCGIALGLGGSTSVLGRAKDVYDFVKHGYKEATIEITLQDKNDYKITITRTIDKVKKCSIWTINNKISTQKQVLSTVKGLNIQVDNLCQFLPQDKVCEFAQMSPIELLKSTLKASGSTELSEDHSKLVLLRNDQKELIKLVEEDSTQVKSLESINQSKKQEVERFKEREEYLRTIELYKKRIILNKYSRAKIEYDQSKIDRKKLQDKVAKMNEKLDPLNKQKEKQERAVEKYTTEANKIESDASKCVVRINRYTKSIEGIQSDIDEAKNQIAQFTNDANERKKQILKLKNEIEGLEHRLSEGIPEEFDMADVRAKYAKLRQQQISLEHQLTESKESQKTVINETKDFKAKISDLQHQLRELDDVKLQKYRLLRAFHQHSYTALNWLSNNQAVFTKIFQPIFLEINLTDLRYADAIEAVVGHQALRTFVCATESDYHRVTGEIIDKQKLRIDVCCFNKTLADFKPPVPVEVIKKLGFDDYLINYIKAPEPILVTLCVKANIHAIPVALNRVNHEKISGMGWIQAYVSEHTRYMVKRSEYGMKSASVVTSRIPRARILIHSANTEKKSSLEKSMTDLREKIAENDQKINERSQDDVKLNSQISEIESQMQEIDQQKLKFQKLQESYNRASASLTNKKAELESLNQVTNDASVDKIKDGMKKLCDKLGKEALKAKNLPSEYTDLVLDSWKMKLKIIEATSKLKTLEKAEDEFDRKQQKAREDLANAQEIYYKRRAEAEELMKEANSSINSAPEDIREELMSFKIDVPLSQLEEELISVQARLNLTLNANEGVIEEYEKRVQEIERLQERIAANENNLSKVAKAVQALHSQWEPKIASLVNSISTNFTEAFQSIGCIGEVQLDRNEDYSRWGINILVKFRDHEKLQLLTGQRQSGGERSVSTIMYLLAIQELAASPFRVVDEINQGMDPKNERMVHRQLVNVACRPETAQYFLITPKLLTNLEYHPKMKVLCIYNGEWQPSDFDTKSYLSQLIAQSQK